MATPRPTLDETASPSLAELTAAAHLAWPGVSLEAKVFARYVTERSAGTSLSALRVSDLYLACGCVLGLPAALATFDAQVLAGALAGVRRIDPSEAFVDEVRQLVRLRLLVGADGGRPRIAEYSGRGALKNWVRATATRTALNLLATAKPEQTLEGGDPLAGSDPELSLLKARHQHDFNEAFRAALRLLSDQERAVLRMHLLEGMSFPKIALVYRVDRSTVTRWVARAREHLLDETQAWLASTLGGARRDLDSLMRALRSDLDVSLARHLQASPK